MAFTVNDDRAGGEGRHAGIYGTRKIKQIDRRPKRSRGALPRVREEN